MKKVLIIISSLVFVAVLIFVVPHIITYFKYNKALSKVIENDFDFAISLFVELDEYRDSQEQIIETKYLKSLYLIENKEYEDAITLLKELDGYKNSNENILSSKYEVAKLYYEKGEFTKSQILFNEIREDISCDEYLKNISVLLLLQGEWVDFWLPGDGIIFKGWNATIRKNGNIINSTYNLDNNKIHLKLSSNVYTLDSDNVLYSMKGTNTQRAHSKGKIKLPSPPLAQPQIGMTKKEIEESTWGKPKSINTTITKYGTSEQWVYSGSKYIYIENGIVTVIQY